MRKPTKFPPRASSGKRWPDQPIPLAEPLHPKTAALVADFAEALAAKLKRAEEKYGYSDGWLTQDWEAECRQHLREHLEKGDPLDVAAYCAFMWRRGWSTAAAALTQDQ